MSIRGLLEFLITILLFPFTYFMLIIGVIINELMRLIVRIILCFRHGDSVFLIENGRDAAYIEARTPTCFIIFKLQQGILTLENVAQYHEEKFQPCLDKKTGRRIYSKLEYIITSAYGYSCWRRDLNFNVRNQIDQLDPDTIYSRAMLEDALSENYKYLFKLDESIPQWRLVIVPKFDDGSGTIKSIVFLAYHHCYFDGLCATMCMKVLSPNAKLIIDPSDFEVPLVINILMHLKTILYFPFLSLRNLCKCFGLIQMWVPNPVKILPRRTFYAFSKNPVDLADVKKIKRWASSVENGASVSISNVLNTAVWRALKTTFPPERLVKDLSFFEVTALLPYPDETLTNRTTFFEFSLPSKHKGGEKEHTEGSKLLLQNLKKVNRNAKKAMAGPDILGYFYFINVIGRLPRIFAPLLLKSDTGSIFVTPLPTWKYKSSIITPTCDIPVETIEGCGPLMSNNGLILCCLTYADEIRFNATGDSNWMSKNELDMFVQQISREMSKMVEEIVDASHKELEGVDLSCQIGSAG